MSTTTKENLKCIASVLMTLAEDLEYDKEYCNRHEVCNAIGPELATNFGLELLAGSMRAIKQDNFSVDYVESLQTALQTMSDFLAKEIEARMVEIGIDELVWDVIDY